MKRTDSINKILEEFNLKFQDEANHMSELFQDHKDFLEVSLQKIKKQERKEMLDEFEASGKAYDKEYGEYPESCYEGEAVVDYFFSNIKEDKE